LIVSNNSSENSQKPNIEFSSDFKADFVGFSQKPYKVGFFCIYIYFYNTRRSIIRHGRKNSHRSRKLSIRLRSVTKCRTYSRRSMRALRLFSSLKAIKNACGI